MTSYLFGIISTLNRRHKSGSQNRTFLDNMKTNGRFLSELQLSQQMHILLKNKNKNILS